MKNNLGKAVVSALVLGLVLLCGERVSVSSSFPDIASHAASSPLIHGPRVVGTTPGKPFLFLVPATGDGELIFSAKDLPDGLALDRQTGIISGSVDKAGIYVCKITVTDSEDSYSRDLNIVAGKNKLALTPPMGWNSWNVWGLSISDAKVRSAADAMVESGLASYGFRYINIDDGWENGRTADGEILTNDKFPDMKALADYVHSMGLKVGIYSSPGPETCGGYEGSAGHEAQDARTYAEWGMDYLKYDWCSYKIDIAGAGAEVFSDPLVWFKAPYEEMGRLLDGQERDIVYSICFYGLWKVETWGEEMGGNLWRTTGDIRDTWKSMSKIGFGQNGLEEYAGPGHWNDPDMLVVGKVGWGPDLHKTRLTPDEQVTHMTLWSILAAPLLLGNDMADMDAFTKDLLTNHEVLEVNQDPLGEQGSRRAKNGKTEVWSRPLWDGTVAVGLFNRGEDEKEVIAKWQDLGISGKQPVRDLWRHKDLGGFAGSFSAKVPAHGAMLLNVGKPEREDFNLKQYIKEHPEEAEKWM